MPCPSWGMRSLVIRSISHLLARITSSKGLKWRTSPRIHNFQGLSSVSSKWRIFQRRDQAVANCLVAILRRSGFTSGSRSSITSSFPSAWATFRKVEIRASLA